MYNSDDLNKVINELSNPSDLPLSLPIVHVSIAKWFKVISDHGKLQPTKCDIFNEKLLYFFYGGVFYRSENKPSRLETELPVAFVFNPSLLNRVSRFFPFDTGGLVKGYFGKWNNALNPMELFQINSNQKESCNLASKIIYYLFKNNESYLQGVPDPSCKTKPDPLPLLFDFYSDDLSDTGADQRQCMIECHFNKIVPLKNELLWVGFPESMTREFSKLCNHMRPYVPQYYPYKTHTIKKPSEICAKLEEMARIQVIDRYVKLP